MNIVPVQADEPIDALDRGVLELLATLDAAAAGLPPAARPMRREAWMAPLYPEPPIV